MNLKFLKPSVEKILATIIIVMILPLFRFIQYLFSADKTSFIRREFLDYNFFFGGWGSYIIIYSVVIYIVMSWSEKEK